MLYILAIVFPPGAVLICGKPVQAALNALLTLAGCLPGIIHAMLVVSSYHADKRTDRIIKAQRQDR